MVEITAPSKRTVILSLTAVVGIVTVSSLAYILLRERNQTSHSRKFRSLQRSLYSQLLKSQDSLDDHIEHNLRRIQVRAKTLRTHRLYPGDDDVKLPSLGLIHEEDKEELGDEIEETKEELIRERTQGFEDHAKVRQGYKKLDLQVKALHKELLRLLERVDKVDLSELAEIGDETGGISQENEAEILAFEKIRKRRRSILGRIQATIAKLDRVQSSYKERLQNIKEYEKLERIGLEPSDDVEPTVESEMMKEGVTFADVASLNIPEPEILAPTEDLERMKQGVSFAAVVAESLPEEKEEHKAVVPKTQHEAPKVKEETPKAKEVTPKAKEETPKAKEEAPKPNHGVSFSPVTETIEAPLNSVVQDEEVLAPTEDLEKMKQGVSFADVVAENIEEPEVLAPTEDLEKMKHGISFADVAKHNIEDEEHKDQGEQQGEHEVLAPTEDLEKMKHGISFADVAKHNTEDEEHKDHDDKDVLAPTEDLEKMKHGVSFADMAKQNVEE
ncbi:hypothetical protein EDD11_003095 [Mortierella claussenii]|nr:hypothetical protein EDD11_003095 [Mortierella claussenii]